MNSAPSSTGMGQPLPRSVRIRPPTRSRASNTRTVQPASVRRAAAARPDTPAPSTSASVVSDGPVIRLYDRDPRRRSGWLSYLRCGDPFVDELLKARLERSRSALPITEDEGLRQKD